MRRPRSSRNPARTLPGKQGCAELNAEGGCAFASSNVLGNTGVKTSFEKLEGQVCWPVRIFSALSPDRESTDTIRSSPPLPSSERGVDRRGRNRPPLARPAETLPSPSGSGRRPDKSEAQRIDQS